MAYTKTVWVNNQAPAINAENLNKIEDGIYNSVRYADAQTLTDEQKTQARANIAAAPDGFGFGALPPVISDPDSLIGTADGIYQFYSLDHPIGIEDVAGILIHYQGNFLEVTGSCRQIFYPAGKLAYHLERAYSGTWTEWEWVNPPMLLGVEYRTTERYLGKPVYKKLLLFTGAMTDGYSDMAHNIANIANVVGCYAELFVGSTTVSTPVLDGNNTIIFSATQNTIRKTAVGNYSQYSARVLMSYTKTTD